MFLDSENGSFRKSINLSRKKLVKETVKDFYTIPRLKSGNISWSESSLAKKLKKPFRKWNLPNDVMGIRKWWYVALFRFNLEINVRCMSKVREFTSNYTIWKFFLETCTCSRFDILDVLTFLWNALRKFTGL